MDQKKNTTESGKTVKRILLVLSLLISTFSFAQSPESSASDSSEFWDDARDAFSLMVQGSYLQFTTVNNLYHSAWGIPAVWYGFENDKRIKNRYGGTEIANLVDNVGDAGVAFNFPLIHSVISFR